MSERNTYGWTIFWDSANTRSKPELATSGGIFTNAEVTYRGVPVGRVGDMSLTSDGIEVDLLIDSSAPQIPASARGRGGQSLSHRRADTFDLQPDTDQGPFPRRPAR